MLLEASEVSRVFMLDSFGTGVGASRQQSQQRSQVVCGVGRVMQARNTIVGTLVSSLV